MTRREFVPLAASLAVSAAVPQSNAELAIERNGWRVVFDTAGRIHSFKSGQTELVNSRHSHVPPRILFPGETAYVCDQPARSSRKGASFVFEFAFRNPYPLLVRLEYELLQLPNHAVALKQSVLIDAAQPIQKRVMVQLPRAVQLPEADRRVFLPLKNGVGRVKRIRGLDNEDDYVYEMAGTRGIGRPQLLAFPMVQEFSSRSKLALNHVADPFFTSLLRLPFGNEIGQYHWIYPESPGLPAGVEQRTFYTIAHTGGPQEAITLFYQTALADVKPGPAWLHEIALINYDYLSKNGDCWFTDIRRLEQLVSPVDRGKVVLVLHGWYGLLGDYTYDPKTQSLAKNWTAFPSARSPKVQALGQGPFRRRASAHVANTGISLEPAVCAGSTPRPLQPRRNAPPHPFRKRPRIPRDALFCGWIKFSYKIHFTRPSGHSSMVMCAPSSASMVAKSTVSYGMRQTWFPATPPDQTCFPDTPAEP